MDQQQEFVRKLVDVQRPLYTYILSLLPSTAEAKDVLQQANVVLLEKQGEYDPSGNFGAWAARIAYFEVLAHRKRQQRDRLYLNDSLVEQLAEEGSEILDAEDQPLRALGNCLEKLSSKDRTLLEKRYAGGLKPGRIAEEVGRSTGAISQALYRIRSTLMRCIEKSLAAEGPA